MASFGTICTARRSAGRGGRVGERELRRDESRCSRLGTIAVEPTRLGKLTVVDPTRSGSSSTRVDSPTRQLVNPTRTNAGCSSRYPTNASTRHPNVPHRKAGCSVRINLPHLQTDTYFLLPTLCTFSIPPKPAPPSVNPINFSPRCPPCIHARGRRGCCLRFFSEPTACPPPARPRKTNVRLWRR